MKYILLITLLLNSLLFATSQVVLGTYSTNKAAIDVKSQIDTIISKDFRFKKFLVKNSIQSIVKEKGKYFIVALEPINDIVTQHAILNRIQKTQFKDAYVLQIKQPLHEEVIADEEDLLLEEEPEIEEIRVPKTNIPRIRTHKQQNMLDIYFNEIMATIAILILSIIYLIIKRRQHTTNEYSEVKLSSKQETPPVEETYKPDDEPRNENENVYAMQENNEIVYDALDDLAKKQKDEKKEAIKNIITISITSNVAKKQVPRHSKITKNDFKHFKGTRIMIAEDNIINQKVINGLLSDSMMDIVTVDDGQEVLNFLEKDSNFSIILMDAHMPNMDGYEATRRIRSNPNYSHITVIALSGDTASDDIKNMKSVGMQEHLEKPLKMDPLYDILYAYSSPQNSSQELNPALSIEDGLKVCGGDEKFYKEILSDFIKDNSSTMDDIDKLLQNKEFTKAQEFLLDLMGVAANIGATRIQELSQELRTSLNHPEDKKYINIFQDFTRNYAALEKEVQEYL